jgi:hypothetical protein
MADHYRLEREISPAGMKEIDTLFARGRVGLVARGRFWDACRLFRWRNRDAIEMAGRLVAEKEAR